MKFVAIALIAISLLFMAQPVFAKAAAQKGNPGAMDLMGAISGSQGGKNLISITLLLTILSFIPAILLLMSSFTRIIIVLSFLRQAM